MESEDCLTLPSSFTKAVYHDGKSEQNLRRKPNWLTMSSKKEDRSNFSLTLIIRIMVAEF
ncbi:hypothetical protein NC652_015170 [Populus alba x Populus x berolinensis]|nr:hypothetical protein NC652_015170 [Populus alba x Populus x berolinensis]